jgi:hypothetical protein
MAFLKSIDQLRTYRMPSKDAQGRNITIPMEWSRSYLWDVRFPDAPPPFDEWFPATEVEENIATLVSQDFEIGNTTIKIPRATTLFDIKLTFHDDANHTLSNWIASWINDEIMNGGVCTRRVSDEWINSDGSKGSTCKPLYVAKLNSMRETISLKHYLVYPDGAIYYSGNSQSEVDRYQVTFIIAGKYTEAKTSPQPTT